MKRVSLLLVVAALASGPARADRASEAGIAADVADWRAGRPTAAATLTAGNVAARLGVMGPEVPVTYPAAMAEALGAMTVRVTDASGPEIDTRPGTAVLGHPVNNLLWLIADGVRLKPGDLVSVGSIGALMPPARAKGRATVTHAGRPGDPTVSVRFDRGRGPWAPDRRPHGPGHFEWIGIGFCVKYVEGLR